MPLTEQQDVIEALAPETANEANQILLLGERHLRRLLREYVAYFNESRPHQGIGQAIPKRANSASNDNIVAAGNVVARPILGGLHHDYRWAA